MVRRALVSACTFALLFGLAGLASAQAAPANFALTWPAYTQDPVNPALTFALQRCLQSAGSCNMIDLAGATAIPLTTLGYADSTIQPNLTYCYRLAAANASGRSPYSPTICGQLGAPPGNAPGPMQLKINPATP